MAIKKLWGYARKPGLLERLSGGRGGRAALILIGAYLVPPLALVLIWLIGLEPMFYEVHWIPALVATPVVVGSIVWLMAAFGFWGVGVNSGQDGGDQFESGFSSGVAFGLGWLRWFLQVAVIGACFLGLIGIWGDFRWWHVVSTPEIESLPERSADMPIPSDWTLVSTREGQSPPGLPQGSYERDFDVPKAFTYREFEEWFSSPEWEAFGALHEIECKSDTEQCEAEVAPQDGGEVTHFVTARYQTTSVERLPPSVDVELRYQHPDVDE